MPIAVERTIPNLVCLLISRLINEKECDSLLNELIADIDQIDSSTRARILSHLMQYGTDSQRCLWGQATKSAEGHEQADRIL